MSSGQEPQFRQRGASLRFAQYLAEGPHRRSLKPLLRRDEVVPLVAQRLLARPQLLLEAGGVDAVGRNPQYIAVVACHEHAGSAEYRVTRWLGVGAAYNYFRLNVDVARADLRGSIDMTMRGPEGFVRFSH